MAQKQGRAGGKYTGNHTTLIPAALLVCDAAERAVTIRKISPGFIKAGLRSVSGKRRVKLQVVSGGIKASIRDNTSQQEVFLYTDDIERALNTLIELLKKTNLIIRVDE